MKLLHTLYILSLLFIPFSLLSQDKDSDEKEDSPKHISDIINDGAKSDDGLFTTHQVEEKLYFEIPDSLLEEDILLVTRIVKIPSNLSPYINAGSKTGQQMVVWQKMGDKLLLRVKSHQSYADESDPIHLSVEANNFEPIIAGFTIEAMDQDSSNYLIDASSLFNKDVKALTGLSARIREQYKVKSLDKSRSLIESVKSFPINVEIRHITTFDASEPPSNSKTQTLSLLMNQSFIKLPEEKMQPRIYDERVGWFTVSQVDYSSEALKADRKTFIRKWKLIPKDIDAYMRGELVEPTKQIVYYLDPATPLKWRPYFRQGIEDWNDCFATAGFKNVIVALDPPTKEEDPDFSPEDARYSTVRYVASETRNAVGPSVSDPRTGEIIESDIIWYHNHLRSYRNRFMLETGAANPKARGIDTPESEIGEMMRRVISHEIGHALGLPHNMKASAAYPVDSLRSGAFTQEYGIATTIMDYARYNYVAQPGDENIRFVRQLGPYDHYSINYGYRYIPDVTTEQEAPILKSWIKEKEGDPIFMFGSGYPRIDPRSQTECIGDDNIQASEYAIQNLKIVGQNLIEWTTKPGENYEDLEELYGEFISVWNRYVNHVVTNVGGIHEELKTSDQAGTVYTAVPRHEQQRAINFLNRHVFSDQPWLIPKAVSSRIGSEGSLELIAARKTRILNSLLSESRLKRLIEGEFQNGKQAYTIEDMLDALDQSIWSESDSGSQSAHIRRILQRNYLSRIENLIQPSTEKSKNELMHTDAIPILTARLNAILKTSKKKAKSKSIHGYHFADIANRIERICPDCW